MFIFLGILLVGYFYIIGTGALNWDDRGLMYALLDVADRVGWAKDPKRPLSEVRDADEAPAVAERAISKYTMHRRCFESFMAKH